MRRVLAGLMTIGMTGLFAASAWGAPTAPIFTPLPPSGGTQLTQARAFATAATLPNGKVLIAGGYTGGFTATTETFDPATPTFAGLPWLSERAYAVAAPLPGGTVLLAGGYPPAQFRTAEIFDPATGSSSGLPATGATQLTAARAGAGTAPLPGGKVLIVGGTSVIPPSGALQTAEIFDPATSTFTALPASGDTQLTVARRGAVVAPLPDGRVLIAGGTSAGPNDIPQLQSAELFDPATITFTALPASGTTQLTIPRTGAVGVALPDGKILIAGGLSGGTITRTAELFDPATTTFTALPASGTTQLGTARQAAVAAVLGDGTVLIAGGLGPVSDTDYLRSAEIVTPAASAGITGTDLGSATVGEPTAVKTVTVTNLGAQPLDIDAATPAVTGTAGEFTIVAQTCSGATLAFRATCTLDVRFTPTAPGARTATITLADNEPSGSAVVTLKGTGLAVPAPPAGPSGPATTGGSTSAPAPTAAAAAKATCTVKRNAKTKRTRITCKVTGVTGKSRTARLTRKGKAIARGTVTATGRLTLTTTKRVPKGSYRLTVGSATFTIRVR